MLDIIRKHEYFDWVERKLASPREHMLKHVQDAWVLAMIAEHAPDRRLTIAEAGGGDSRVLEALKPRHECWNIDRFEGAGNGPQGVPEVEDVRIVPAYLGDFDSRLPDAHFDVVFSISVMEHVSLDAQERFFRDCTRILKPGGLMLHAIDLYVFDRPKPKRNERISRYVAVPEELQLPLAWLNPPTIDESVRFRCEYATNSDATLAKWNRLVPTMRHVREQAQHVSIKAAWRKLEPGGRR